MRTHPVAVEWQRRPQTSPGGYPHAKLCASPAAGSTASFTGRMIVALAGADKLSSTKCSSCRVAVSRSRASAEETSAALLKLLGSEQPCGLAPWMQWLLASTNPGNWSLEAAMAAEDGILCVGTAAFWTVIHPASVHSHESGARHIKRKIQGCP